jgi:hypothetical protein
VAASTASTSSTLPSASRACRTPSRRQQRGHLGVDAQLDALLHHLGGDEGAHVVVEAAQHLGAAVKQRHPAAEPVEDRRELAGDVAAADHQQPARERLEVEHLVRGQRQFLAGEVRPMRCATGGDEDVLGADALAADVDRVRIGKPRAAAQQPHAGTEEQLLVDAVEPHDLDRPVALQRRPVERRRRAAEAVAVRFLESLAVVRGIAVQLLRDAAEVDAGAAQRPLSASATRAPRCAAMRAARTPPLPPPITNRSYSCMTDPPRELPPRLTPTGEARIVPRGTPACSLPSCRCPALARSSARRPCGILARLPGAAELGPDLARVAIGRLHLRLRGGRHPVATQAVQRRCSGRKAPLGALLELAEMLELLQFAPDRPAHVGTVDACSSAARRPRTDPSVPGPAPGDGRPDRYLRLGLGGCHGGEHPGEHCGKDARLLHFLRPLAVGSTALDAGGWTPAGGRIDRI